MRARSRLDSLPGSFSKICQNPRFLGSKTPPFRAKSAPAQQWCGKYVANFDVNQITRTRVNTGSRMQRSPRLIWYDKDFDRRPIYRDVAQLERSEMPIADARTLDAQHRSRGSTSAVVKIKLCAFSHAILMPHFHNLR